MTQTLPLIRIVFYCAVVVVVVVFLKSFGKEVNCPSLRKTISQLFSLLCWLALSPSLSRSLTLSHSLSPSLSHLAFSLSHLHLLLSLSLSLSQIGSAHVCTPVTLD